MREINPSHTCILLLQHWDTQIIIIIFIDHFFIKIIYFLFVPGHRTSQGCLLFFTLTIQAIIQDGESAFSKAAPEVKKTPEKHWCHRLPSPSVRTGELKFPKCLSSKHWGDTAPLPNSLLYPGTYPHFRLGISKFTVMILQNQFYFFPI